MKLRWLIGILLSFCFSFCAWAGTPGVLAQANPAATTLTAIYTVPNTPINTAVISTIRVANRDVSASHAFRLSVASAGAADAPEQYIYYDVLVPPRGAVVDSVYIPLRPADVVRAYVDAQQLSISLFGTSTP